MEGGSEENENVRRSMRSKRTAEVEEEEDGEEGTLTGLYCSFCDRTFANNHNLRKHRAGRFCRANSFKCEKCAVRLTTPQSKERHMQRFHAEGGAVLAWACGICVDAFETKEKLIEHRTNAHQIHHDFKERASAHRGVFKSLRAFIPEEINTLDESMFYTHEILEKLLTSLAAEGKNYFKVGVILHVQMFRLNDEAEVEQEEVFPFRTQTFFVKAMSDHTEDVALGLGDIERSVTEFLHRGSGWVVDRGIFVDVEISQCEPLSGQANGMGAELHEMQYMRGVGLAATIEEHDNSEGECFYRAIASYFCGPLATRQQVNHFMDTMIVRLDNGNQGVAVADIKHFESLNKHLLSVNLNVLYQDENKALIPVYAGRQLHAEHTIVLVLFHTVLGKIGKTGRGGEGKRVIQHYALAREPQRLFAKRFCSDKDGKVRTSSIFICWNCFNYQKRKSAHEAHIRFCYQQNCQRVVMPAPWEKKCFKNVDKANSKIFKSAFILVFDFEALHVSPKTGCSCSEEIIESTRQEEEKEKEREEEWEKSTEKKKEEISLDVHMAEGEAIIHYEKDIFENYVSKKKAPPKNLSRVYQKFVYEPKVCKHKTQVLAEQPPFAFAYVLLDRDGRVRKEKAYVGMDAPSVFLEEVLDMAEEFLPTLSPGRPIEEMSVEERMHFYRENVCHICEKMIGVGDKVLDHDHLNGKILGVAHNACNLKRRELCKITCFAHNFINYDGHFVIKALPSVEDRITNVFAIPLNSQKIKALELNKRVLFVDSLAFMDGSLSDMVNILKESKSRFPIFRQFTGNVKEGEMLMRKGVYPYSFATSIEKLVHTREVPAIDEFHNDLTGEKCSEEDYVFAWDVWKKFRCKNLLEYTVLYVKTDVFLLADVIFDFRNKIWTAFGLDMAQYLSLPHMTMDAMLKTTGVSLDYMYDQEMSNLVRQNIRGGLSFVQRRYQKGDEKQNTLAYVDVNSLYAAAMCHPLPVGDYQWCTQEEIDNFSVERDVSSHSNVGYFLEVDLDYPSSLHLLHNSYPLAPENREIRGEELSAYSKKCLLAFGKKIETYKSKKLTSTFHPRKNYLVHGQCLQFYLREGLVLKKIHRIIKFQQAAFLRPFIELCQQKRQQALSPLESLIWKLCCNSVYGKFIESAERRMSCYFNYNESSALRRATNPLYQSSLICQEDFSISFMRKGEVVLRQLFGVGFAILELSKLIMGKLYHHGLLRDLGAGNVSVVMSDTDSFLFLARNQGNIDEVMYKLRGFFDFSNLPLEHPLYSAQNKRRMGLIKNEFPNKVITEVVALKAKTYSVQVQDKVDFQQRQTKSSFLENLELERKRLKAPIMSVAKRVIIPSTSRGQNLSPVVVLQAIPRDPPLPSSSLPLLIETCNRAKGVKKAVKDKIPFQYFLNCLKEIKKTEVEQVQIRSYQHVCKLIWSKKVAFSSFDDKRFLLCAIHSVPYGSVFIEYDGCYFCKNPDQVY